MDQIVHDVRRDHWLSIVSACQERPEGMQVREWLAENGIKEKAYYYWQRKFRKELCAQLSEDTKDLPTVKSPEFVEIPIQKQVSEVSSAFTFNPDAVINLDGCVVAFSNNTSNTLVNAIMEGLKYAR